MQTTLRAASTSSGELTVKNGTLTFGADGSWTNCTAVTIAGVSQDMEFLYLEDENGKWRKQSLGTWGASGVAAHTHACFTGTGVVKFFGDGKGMSIIFK